MILDNGLSRVSLYDEHLFTLLNFLHIPDLKYLGIEKAKAIIAAIPPKPEKKNTFIWTSSDFGEFRKQEKYNHLVKFVLMCHAELYEFTRGIDYYKANYRENKNEVKLYILISMLFGYGQKDLIVREIEEAEKEGIKPRDRLMHLKKYILDHGALPAYMP